MDALLTLLNNTQAAPILPEDILNQPYYIFKLGHPSDFSNINPQDTQAMVTRTQELLKQHQAAWGIGRYGEQRELYTHPQYTQTQRSVHLGLDLSAPAGTEIFAPIAGKCHSFQNNAQAGDYGPTIILEHHLNNITFFTLYGHLNHDSIQQLKIGQAFKAGDHLGNIGAPSENGGWPPHCHVQLIRDIGNYHGDFPGVCCITEAAEWLHRCPDPSTLLKLFNKT